MGGCLILNVVTDEGVQMRLQCIYYKFYFVNGWVAYKGYWRGGGSKCKVNVYILKKYFNVWVPDIKCGD